MNLILFEPHEISRPLPLQDRRAVHIVEVLRCHVGDVFDVGVIDGSRGKAILMDRTNEGLTLTFAWDASPPPPLHPTTLIVGLPRPQTARDILRDAATLGVAALHFVRTEKGERSYAQSTLWSSGEWRRHLVIGAEQGFVTRLPRVTHGTELTAALESIADAGARFALDNYESPTRLGACEIGAPASCVLAVGSERGWSAKERDVLRAQGFALVHLGTRVLRTETAVLAALSIVHAKLGLM